MRGSGDRSSPLALRRRQALARALALSLAGVAAPAGASDRSPGTDRVRRLRLLAPVSLSESLDASLEAFGRREAVQPPTVVYGGTPALVRQIQQGLAADLVITADELWMDRLQSEDRLMPQTRRILIRNQLVLIAPKIPLSTPDLSSTPRASSTPSASSTSGSSSILSPRELDATLRTSLGQGRLAVADLQTVPAGRYAREALQWAQWESLTRGRLAQTDHVRAALRLVARGEASLGIVYETDALTEPRVKVLYRFPAQSHAEIRIPIAQLKADADSSMGTMALVQSLLAWLFSAQGRAAFLSRGFLEP